MILHKLKRWAVFHESKSEKKKLPPGGEDKEEEVQQ